MDEDEVDYSRMGLDDEEPQAEEAEAEAEDDTEDQDLADEADADYVEPDADYADEDPEPVAAAPVAPAVRTARPAPVVTATALTEAEREELTNQFIESPIDAMDRHYEMRRARERQEESVAGYHSRSFAEQNPEFMAVYGDDVREMVQNAVAQRPNDPEAIKRGQRLGVLNAMLKEMDATDDIAGVVAKAARLLSKEKPQAKPAPRAAPAPRAVVPPAQRVPVPSSGSGRSSAAPARREAPRVAGGRVGQTQKMLMDDLGLPSAYAAMLADQ